MATYDETYQQPFGQQPPQQQQYGGYPAPQFGSSQPYAYGMNDTNPTAMAPAPMQTMPSLYPSTMTPQLNPPSPYGQQRMARGGLAQAAERVRRAGTGSDKVLAHIEPEEAALLGVLAEYQGGRTNRKTGLPEYGFGKFMKKAFGVAAPVVGGIFGGPIGAGLGGALGAKVNNRNPLMGAGLGALGAGGILGGLGGGLGGLGKMFSMGFMDPSKTGGEGGGGLGGLFGGGLENLLLPVALIAGLNAKKSIPPETQNMSDVIKAMNSSWRPDQYPNKVKPLERVRRAFDPTEPGEFKEYEDVNPATEYHKAEGGLIAPEYAHGGLTHYMANGGYLDGHTGGQDDTIPAQLSDGEFVISADVVSGLGDGNNKAGAQKLHKLMASVRQHKAPMSAKGKLPPKAKSLQAYMGGRV